MKKIISSLIFLSFAINSIAQNYVSNSTFEYIEKKPKELGMIYLAEGWFSPTGAQATLFSESAKSELIRIPENKYGAEKPKQGENYAGLLLYSYNEREPRTYLSTKLTSPLEKGKHYCIRFHVSLSDLSKFAVNNIGLYVSDTSIKESGEGILNYEPQIIHSRNRIFEQQWDWEAICRIYVAEGGEQYITIGNFAKQADVSMVKVKRPKGFTSSQLSNAYYYVDDITVIANGTRLNCKCEEGNYAFAHLDKEEKSFGSNPDDAPKTEFISSRGVSTTGGTTTATATEKKAAKPVFVPFELGRSTITDAGTTLLDKAIETLKSEKELTVTVIGHIDETEEQLPNVSEKRMNEVRKYLISKGIDQSRITTNDVRANAPIDNSGLKENRKKNTVVELQFE
jgi:outer membrane protein OmpA-like peptidoglycan-associated protein